VVSSFRQGLQSTLLKWSLRSTLVPRFSSLYQYPICEETPQIGVSHSLTKMITVNTRVREGERTHIKAQHRNTHKKQRQEREYKITQEQLKNSTQISLKSLDGVVAECRSVGVLLRHLGTRWRHLWGPFYSPKGPRSCWSLHLEAPKLPCMRVHHIVRCATIQCTITATKSMD
jgi:hypothetical protein